MQHELKTIQPYFQEVWNGNKMFEVRKNDRHFILWDTLTLCEYNPTEQVFTGRRIDCVASYVLYGGAFGIADDHCVIALAELQRYSL